MRIKQIREDKGISQKELAKKIGVKPSTLSRYEKGLLFPNSQTLKDIAEYLNVDINSLYEADENKILKSPEKLKLDIINEVLKISNDKLEQILKFIENLKNNGK